MSSASEPTTTVVAFDFDKTLSSRDNVLPFLATVAGQRAVARTLVASLPDVVRGRRNAMKARLTRLLAGRSESELQSLAQSFATDVVARHLRADVLARAAWHGQQGHERVIVSASYECYLAPIAAALDFDAALGTRLEIVDGCATGRTAGTNVRRVEKVRRLDEWLAIRGQGDESATIWAYGDSAGDRELFARADHAVRVGRERLDPSGVAT